MCFFIVLHRSIMLRFAMVLNAVLAREAIAKIRYFSFCWVAEDVFFSFFMETCTIGAIGLG